ncbi:MAG: hypothetical protein IJA07_09265 [Agathobacter sp.]|nr:hypothetical protein [Agathobacter sp.]
MGLFDKIFKQKGNRENQIENRGLKENLANAALGLLVQGVDYENLAYIEVEFGYLFLIENHGLEALYKITTDKDVFYFVAQQEKLMRVEINEAMFKTTTETFLEMHE